MKAIVRDRYGSPDVVHMGEIDTPAPGDDQVLVRVHAASLNTADSDLLRGWPRVARLGTGLRRPKTRRVGLDVAGRVEAVGRTVTALRPGDEVWADLFAFGHGSFAEYVCAPATALAPKPTSTTFEEAATVPHSGVLALQGLMGKGPIRPGERVLINGAGGCVGPFAVQIASPTEPK
jgi:NADPH:quinone reductase-like Zn-dependent oxidoreductase